MIVWLLVPWGRGILLCSWNPRRNPALIIVWLLVPWGQGILICSWTPIRNPNDCMINCSMGPGRLWYLLETPIRKPNDCMFNSIWYVEATCSGQHPSNIIQHKTLPVVWRCTEFPYLRYIYAYSGLGQTSGSVCNIIIYIYIYIGGASGQLFFTAPKTYFATFFPHFKGSFSTFPRPNFHV